MPDMAETSLRAVPPRATATPASTNISTPAFRQHQTSAIETESPTGAPNRKIAGYLGPANSGKCYKGSRNGTGMGQEWDRIGTGLGQDSCGS